MNEQKKIYRVILCLMAAGSMLFANVTMAASKVKTSSAAGSAKVAKEVKAKTLKAAGDKRATVMKEAVAALAQTGTAIEALDKKDKQQALDTLALVTGKLDIVIARAPELALAPIDVRVQTYDLINSVDVIKETVKTARELLKDGEVQQARDILMGLISEVDVTVTSIPLASYSDGIKSVARLVDKEKYQEAKDGLYDLISTLVVTKNIIPLPILRAEEMIRKADALAIQENRTQEQNKQLEE
ncbi:MAG: hypothetical protein DSY58_00935, partial [Desulfobulbus sp.]